jgi:uncharacterized protein YigE (DUF2233 family)
MGGPFSWVVLVLFAAITEPAHPVAWERLDEGLEYARFPLPKPPAEADHPIDVVRIDPKYYGIRLLMAGELGTGRLPVDEWARRYDLVAAVNASMYRRDFKTSVCYMRNGDHVNNGKFGEKFGVFFVAGTREPGAPDVRLIERRREKDWQALIGKYRVVAQNYGMISANRHSTWTHREGQPIHSTACVGVDTSGRILLVLSRAPFQVADLNEVLLKLPIDIATTMYVEGGPEASLYVRAGDREIRRMGSWETDFMESDRNDAYLPIPNVIGVVKRRSLAQAHCRL